VGCKAPAATAPAQDTEACIHEGVVQDFTGLDGCRLLIVMPDGRKLLAASSPEDGPGLAAGMHIRFGYRELPDAMSICMAENAIVALTCLELVKMVEQP
jgi:hypothetical protein